MTHNVGDVSDLLALRYYGRRNFRMVVTARIYGDTAGEIDISSTFITVYVTAFSRERYLIGFESDDFC